MASYVIRTDYNKTIQDSNLEQIITSNQTLLNATQIAAIQEAKNFVNAKYNADAEFTDTEVWSPIVEYKASRRVYLDADAYAALTEYEINDLVLYGGNIYIALLDSTGETPGATPDPQDPITFWELIGAQYDMYYGTLPALIFDYLKIYKTGDEIFYLDKVYIALKDTTIISHQSILDGNYIIKSPVQNVFPNDTDSGAAYWGVGTEYTIPAGTPLDDADFWTPGDNRDQKMLMSILDITLYHLHSRIAPRNIPELRVHRYMGQTEDRIATKNRIIYPIYSALGWLQSLNSGEDIKTVALQSYQPAQGGRIAYGGTPKNINSY